MTAYHEQNVNRIRFAFVQQTISLFFLGLTYVSKVKDQDLKLTKQIHEQTFFHQIPIPLLTYPSFLI